MLNIIKHLPKRTYKADAVPIYVCTGMQTIGIRYAITKILPKT